MHFLSSCDAHRARLKLAKAKLAFNQVRARLEKNRSGFGLKYKTYLIFRLDLDILLAQTKLGPSLSPFKACNLGPYLFNFFSFFVPFRFLPPHFFLSFPFSKPKTPKPSPLLYLSSYLNARMSAPKCLMDWSNQFGAGLGPRLGLELIFSKTVKSKLDPKPKKKRKEKVQVELGQGV